MITIANPEVTGRLQADYKFKGITECDLDGQTVALEEMRVTFSARTEWLAQTVQLDAANGIYDYARGRIRLAPGANQSMIKGINFDEAEPLDRPPADNFAAGLMPGEVDMSCILVNGVGLTEIPDLRPIADLIIPEDLTTEIQE